MATQPKNPVPRTSVPKWTATQPSPTTTTNVGTQAPTQLGYHDYNVNRTLNKYNKSKLDILKNLRNYLHSDPTKYGSLIKQIDDVISKTKIYESAYSKYYSHLLNEQLWSGLKQKYTDFRLNDFSKQLQINWMNATKELAQLFNVDISDDKKRNNFIKNIYKNNISNAPLDPNIVKSIGNFYVDHNSVDNLIKQSLKSTSAGGASKTGASPVSSPRASAQRMQGMGAPKTYTREQQAQNYKNASTLVKSFIQQGNEILKNISKIMPTDDEKKFIRAIDLRKQQVSEETKISYIPHAKYTPEILKTFTQLQTLYGTLIFNLTKLMNYPIETFTIKSMDTFVENMVKGVDIYQRPTQAINPRYSQAIGLKLKDFNHVIDLLNQLFYSVQMDDEEVQATAASNYVKHLKKIRNTNVTEMFGNPNWNPKASRKTNSAPISKETELEKAERDLIDATRSYKSAWVAAQSAWEWCHHEELVIAKRWMKERKLRMKKALEIRNNLLNANKHNQNPPTKHPTTTKHPNATEYTVTAEYPNTTEYPDIQIVGAGEE